jgi:hypothetical protein
MLLSWVHAGGMKYEVAGENRVKSFITCATFQFYIAQVKEDETGSICNVHGTKCW